MAVRTKWGKLKALRFNVLSIRVKALREIKERIAVFSVATHCR